MVGENDPGRTDPCAKHIDGRTNSVQTLFFARTQGFAAARKKI